ncbi:MAG: DUF4174 domain-containing protein [Candidatus Neomarinimicrobiota bacterium]
MFISFILLLFLNLDKLKSINHLSDFKWKNRVLVVVTNEKEEIKDLIKIHNIGLNEREFVVIQLDDEKAFIDYNQMSKRFSQSILKKVKNIPQQVYFVLIGKDGRIKNLFSKNTGMNEIFSEVDKMPMRINEMKRNPKNH